MPVKPVEALIRGLEILEALSANPPGLRLKEVTELTGLPKATAYRILQTLIAKNYVHYFTDSGEFRLGPKVMSLGYSTLSGFDLVSTAEPYIAELSRTIGQNVNLGTLDGSEVVYIIRIKVRRILGINLAVGSRLAAYSTAIGRALLAFIPPNELEKVIALTAQEPEAARQIGPGGSILKEKLKAVRKKGYVLMEDEFVAGLRSVAVPVLSAQGFAEAAINVPVFSQQCSRQELEEQHLPLVLKTAKTISSLRGYLPS
jgi:IclR family pca regulon transcriptional regulator